MALSLRVLIVFAALTKCGIRKKNDDHFLITFFYFLYAVATHILEHNLRLVFPHTRPVMEGCSDATCLNIKERHLSMKDRHFCFYGFFFLLFVDRFDGKIVMKVERWKLNRVNNQVAGHTRDGKKHDSRVCCEKLTPISQEARYFPVD